jgi:hypothetical protein
MTERFQYAVATMMFGFFAILITLTAWSRHLTTSSTKMMSNELIVLSPSEITKLDISLEEEDLRDMCPKCPEVKSSQTTLMPVSKSSCANISSFFSSLSVGKRKLGPFQN